MLAWAPSSSSHALVAMLVMPTPDAKSSSASPTRVVFVAEAEAGPPTFSSASIFPLELPCTVSEPVLSRLLAPTVVVALSPVLPMTNAPSLSSAPPILKALPPSPP